MLQLLGTCNVGHVDMWLMNILLPPLLPTGHGCHKCTGTLHLRQVVNMYLVNQRLQRHMNVNNTYIERSHILRVVFQPKHCIRLWARHNIVIVSFVSVWPQHFDARPWTVHPEGEHSNEVSSNILFMFRTNLLLICPHRSQK